MISIERYLLISKLFRSIQKLVNSSIVQLFGIKKDNWLISPSLKKQNKTKQSKKQKQKAFPDVLPRSMKRYPLYSKLFAIKRKQTLTFSYFLFPSKTKARHEPSNNK